MDWLAPLASGDDWTVLAALLTLSGGGLLILLAGNMVQGRADIRRRAAAPVAAGGASLAGGGGGTDTARFINRLMTYAETTFAGGDEKQTKVLRRQLIQAGFFDQRAVAVYFAARLGSAIVMAAGAFLLLPLFFPALSGSSQWMFTAILGLGAYLAPNFYLGRRIKSRATQHRLGFPDFMDLMVVCAEAGLSMEAAIDRIARELVEGHPSLAENLYMVSLEIRAGKGFTEALQRMGERLGIEEASMLATLLQQSAELGTSLSQSLRVYSDEMRQKRMARAEEKAHALPAKLMLPLMLFVFPVLLITLMLPVVIRVAGMSTGN